MKKSVIEEIPERDQKYEEEKKQDGNSCSSNGTEMMYQSNQESNQTVILWPDELIMSTCEEDLYKSQFHHKGKWISK